MLRSKQIQLLYIFILLCFVSVAQAGHLFTQASSNTPTWIQAGQGIAIDQYGDEGGSGNGRMSIYFKDNSTIPSGADTSTTDWWEWSSGDVMRITLPLADATYTYTFAYDAAGSGGCTYTACGKTGSSQLSISDGETTLGQSGVTLPSHSGQQASYTSSDVSFTWSIEALAGDFSLSGYRIYTSAGTIDGTGAGPLSQSSVVSSSQVQQSVSGGSTPDIDTGKAEYTEAELNGGSVNPKFAGGTLKIATSATAVSSAFTVDSTGGKIQSDGDFTISGVISDDASGASGRLSKDGSGTLTLTGVNTLSSGFDIDAGGLAIEGSLTGSVVVSANGTLKGSGTVGGITNNGTIAPGSSPGTLTSTASVTNTASSITQIEVDGDTYNAAGGAGSYDRIDITGPSSTYGADGTLELHLRGISAPANNNFTPELGDSFRIVTTANASGVSGNYANVTQPTSGLGDNTRIDVLYGNNYIDLTVTPDSYADYMQTLGKENIAAFSKSTEGDRPSAGSTTTTGLGDFYINLIGKNANQMLSAMAQATGEIHIMSFNSLRDDLKRLSGIAQDAVHYDEHNSALWVKADRYFLEYLDDKSSHGYKANGHEITIGYDLENSETKRFGLGGSYLETDLTTASLGTSNTTGTYLFGYYKDKNPNDGIWTFDMGVGKAKRNIARTVTIGATTNSHTSSINDNTAFANMSFEMPMESTSDYNVSRFINVSAMWIEGNPYAELGASPTALSIDNIVHGDLSTEVALGYKFSKVHDILPLSYNLSLSAYTDNGGSFDAYQATRTVRTGATSWELNANNVGDLAGRLQGHVQWEPYSNLQSFLSVNIDYRDGFEQYEAQAGLSYNF